MSLLVIMAVIDPLWHHYGPFSTISNITPCSGLRLAARVSVMACYGIMALVIDIRHPPELPTVVDQSRV